MNRLLKNEILEMSDRLEKMESLMVTIVNKLDQSVPQKRNQTPFSSV